MMSSVRNGIKILVVDDDDMMAEFIRDVIREMGYDSYHAKYGSEALLALRACGKFSLMITDLEMPGMGGERLIDEVLLNFKTMPIIVLSGSVADRRKRESLYMKGVQEVLEKPISLNDLEKAIRHHMQPTSIDESMVS